MVMITVTKLNPAMKVIFVIIYLVVMKQNYYFLLVINKSYG